MTPLIYAHRIIDMNEQKFLDYIQSKRNRFMDRFWIAVTRLGDGGIVWLPLISWFLYSVSRRTKGIALLITLSVNLILCNGLLKNLIRRIRPCDRNEEIELLIRRPADFSFPSAHTASCFAITTALFIMGETTLAVPALIISLLVGYSRVYLYVHYPSDIIAGIITGMLAAYISLDKIWTRW